MLKTATTDATTVKLGSQDIEKQSVSYKRQEPENLHTRVYKGWALSSAPLMFIFNKCWNIVPKDWKRPTVYKYLQSIE